MLGVELSLAASLASEKRDDSVQDLVREYQSIQRLPLRELHRLARRLDESELIMRIKQEGRSF